MEACPEAIDEPELALSTIGRAQTNPARTLASHCDAAPAANLSKLHRKFLRLGPVNPPPPGSSRGAANTGRIRVRVPLTAPSPVAELSHVNPRTTHVQNLSHNHHQLASDMWSGRMPKPRNCLNPLDYRGGPNGFC